MIPLIFPLAVLLLAQQPPAPTQAPAHDAEPAPTGSAIIGPQWPGAASEGEKWKSLDEPIHIVNEDMLTLRKLMREMYRRNRAKPFHDQAEAQTAEKDLRVQSVKDALQVQAGQDMGLDPAQVDRQVKDWVNRKKEQKGSAEFAGLLKESGITLYEYQDMQRDGLLALFWDNYITGNGSVGAARQSRDRFVRPGYLQFAFRECLNHQEFLPVIGGHEQSVVLQLLHIDPKGNGGLDPSRTLAEDLRRRIADGEDMGELVEKYDASHDSKQKRGILDPLRESSLIQADPALGAFVAEAKPGDISEVQEYKSKGLTYWRIVRLLERSPAVVPDLTSLEVQQKLDKRVKESVENWRREEAFRLLYRTSYVWPSEYSQR
jgi:hypothetical protein